MKRDELGNLVIKSLTGDISPGEREALEMYAIPDYRFRSDFRERLLAGIFSAGSSVRNIDFFRSLDRIFLKTVLTGAAAIALLVITLLMTQGSLNFDTILGFDSSIDEGLISLLIE